MNIDALKAAWHADVSSQAPDADLQRLSRQARASARHYQRAARLRVFYGSTAFGLTLAMLVVVALLPHVWPGMRLALALWSASLVACSIGLWRTRRGSRVAVDAPLQPYLQSCLRRIRREIAYHRSLRWLFWLPFTAGLLSAMLWQAPVAPGPSWIVLLMAICIWGFIEGPRHGPRLQPQAEELQRLLDGASAADSTAGHA